LTNDANDKKSNKLIDQTDFDDLIHDLVNNQGMEKAIHLDLETLEVLSGMLEELIESEQENPDDEEGNLLEVFFITMENLMNIIDLKLESTSYECFEDEMIEAVYRGCTVVPPNDYMH